MGVDSKRNFTGPSPMEVLMATISWLKDVDAALAEAKTQGKPVLLDFSAAPM